MMCIGIFLVLMTDHLVLPFDARCQTLGLVALRLFSGGGDGAEKEEETGYHYQ